MGWHVSHASMRGSNTTLSDFSDGDRPSDADGSASERRDCRPGSLLSASSSSSVIFPVNVESCDSGVRSQNIPLMLRKVWLY